MLDQIFSFSIPSSVDGFLSFLFYGFLPVVLAIIVLWLLFSLVVELWLFIKRTEYKEAVSWALLEIHIPREVKKTPKAMEQFFLNVHGLRNAPGNFLEMYVDGEVTLWWSLEVVSFGGEIHFFIRTPKKYVKMIQAAMYAQYPEVEITETAADYISRIPDTTEEIYKQNFNVFGSELVLREDDIIPIATYEQFFQPTLHYTPPDKKETSNLDPISSLLEAFAGLQKEEVVFLQFLIRPAGSDWQKKGKKKAVKLFKGKDKPGPGFSDAFGVFVKNFIKAPVKHPEWPEAAKPEKEEPGRTDIKVAEAIENNLWKPGFDTLIRFLYYAPKPIFSTNFARKGILGALNQYSSSQLNSFSTNKKTETRGRWIYFPYVNVDKRVEARKQRLLSNYKLRKMPEDSSLGKIFSSHVFNWDFASKTFILNTAELATIFHIPTDAALIAPTLKKIESKRMGPPAGLPIFLEEGEEQ